MLPDMKKNADGSLTLYVQKDSPGADKESNWLPAPNGPDYIVMRLYWPKEEALKGGPTDFGAPTTANRSRAAAPRKSAMRGRPPRTRDGCKWAGRNNENENDHLCNAGAWPHGGAAG